LPILRQFAAVAGPHRHEQRGQERRAADVANAERAVAESGHGGANGRGGDDCNPSRLSPRRVVRRADSPPPEEATIVRPTALNLLSVRPLTPVT
jgi:hypothetical protein